MNWKRALPYAVLGVSLAVLGAIIKSYAMFDRLANLTFPYLGIRNSGEFRGIPGT